MVYIGLCNLQDANFLIILKALHILVSFWHKAIINAPSWV